MNLLLQRWDSGPSSVRVERSRDTGSLRTTDGHLDFARCERDRETKIRDFASPPPRSAQSPRAVPQSKAERDQAGAVPDQGLR